MNRPGPARTIAALACLALGLAACAEPATTRTSTTPSSTVPAEATTEPTAEPSSTAAATESPAAPATQEVTVEASQFMPGQLTIAAGTEVTFVNRDSFAHTVTEGTGGQAAGDPIADEMLDGGSSVEITFADPGTYEITCRFHPTMQMTIVVEDG